MRTSSGICAMQFSMVRPQCGPSEPQVGISNGMDNGKRKPKL